jgi:kumamolisin
MPLPGSERPSVTGHTPVGPVDLNEQIGVTLLLRPKPGSPPLPDLTHWEATPPGRRRFLTPEEFANTYGASQEDIDAVVAFARAHGLTVTGIHAGRRSVHVEGTVAQLNAAFGVTLTRYQGKRPACRVKSAAAAATAATHVHHGYDGPIQLPPDLVDVVRAVVGLDNRSLGDAGGSSGDPPNANLLPVPTVAGLYNFPNSGASDQTIGVIAPSDPVGTANQRVSGYLSGDILNNYFPNLSNANYRTKPTLQDVSVKVGRNTYSNNTSSVSISNSFALEVTQDISTSATIAQGATVNVYFTELTEQGLVACLNRILQPEGERQPTVVTCSFNFYAADGSIGSPSNPGSVAAVVSGLFHELAVQGINAFMISQDRGSNDGDTDGQTHVNYPGSDPWVTCVGGTVIGNVNSGPPVTFDEWVWSNVGFAQGPNNSLVYYWATPGSNWSGDLVAGNGTTFSAPFVFVRSNGEADIVAQGPNDSLMYYWAASGSNWSSVQVAGNGTTFSAPCVVVRSGGEADIVAMG